MLNLKLFTLGPPRIECDGVPLELHYRKNVALIAYLAVTGECHTREALVTLLWPELEPRRARANLRRDLSVLRKALGPACLVVDRETVGLERSAGPSTPPTGAGQAFWLDVDRFHHLLSAWQGHGHPQADLCPTCLGDLAEAVELYRGDFLAGFSLRDSVSFDDWQSFQTEDLRRELASALERLVRGHSAQGAYESAIPYARRWLALDPLHEPVHRHLMGLYAQTGQRAAALRQYQECARILETELGLSPSQASTSLYERIRAEPADGEEPLFPVSPPQHNLPAQLTPFVGREADLAAIKERLQDPGCRLLTLVGPGGIGKTRLALEAAREQVGCFEDGVRFCALAPVRSIDTVVSTVAQAIDPSFYQGSNPWRRLLDYLRHRRLLLVLDNLEHLIDAPHPTGRGAVDLTNGILQAAPGVKIVITSRARLNVQSEHLLPISGMDYPKLPLEVHAQRHREQDSLPSIRGASRQHPEQSEGQDAARYSAVRLFLATARRVCPGFEPAASSLAHVGQICALVQGMPLAILLAASWMEVLSPAEIAAELRQGYDLLETDWRDLPERQRSIEAVFDASWRMLDDAEREAFARLSVFRGGFARRAAQNVAGASPWTLMSLARKSFVQRDATGRYQIHELLRQYGECRLAENPEQRDRTFDLHCDYYAGVLDRGLADAYRGSGWQGLLLEMDNLRAGWHWAVSRHRLAKVREYLDITEVYYYHGWSQEGGATLEWAADVMRTHCAGQASGEAGIVLGLILLLQGNVHAWADSVEPIEKRVQLVREGVSILRRLGARRELAQLGQYAAYAYGLEHSAEARQLLQETLATRQELGDLQGTSDVLAALGELAVGQGAYDEAERYCQEALHIGREIDDTTCISSPLIQLGKVAYHRGAYQMARQLYEEGLDIPRKHGLKFTAGYICSYLGDTALAMGDYEEARERHQEARALYEEMDIHWGQAFSGEHWGLAYSLDRLGDIALVEGNIEGAEGCYQQALRIAGDRPHVALKLDVLVSQAALLARKGHEGRAAELAALALHHPASDKEVKGRAQRVLNELEAELSPAVFAAAQERGRARDPEVTVEELLVELKSDPAHPALGNCA